MSARVMPRMVRCECCGAPIVQEVRHGGVAALPIAERARRAVAAEVEGCPEDCWRFLAACWPDDPTRGLWSANAMADALAVIPSTLMCRFFRAQLPAPALYLRRARLVVAASMLDDGFAWCRAAMEAGASSPQSLGRTLRHEWGIGSTELRELGAAWALEKYLDTLVRPYAATLRGFRPLTADVCRRPRLVAA